MSSAFWPVVIWCLTVLCVCECIEMPTFAAGACKAGVGQPIRCVTLSGHNPAGVKVNSAFNIYRYKVVGSSWALRDSSFPLKEKRC